MSDFTASACSGGQLDPRKRVNYALGLVLGEDDLRQEQFYLRERDHRAVRALHGYGTVAGLSVAVEQDRVIVKPGLAVDSAGRLICVPGDQCADLGDWLGSHRDAVLEHVTGSPGLPDELPLYVVLCYRECETDKVPLPSEPCQSDEESMAASRITDGFELRLAFEPPPPANELEGGLLGELIDALVHPDSASPPSASPPGDPLELENLREQIAGWVLHHRPELKDRPCLAPSADTCVLLARIDVEIDVLDDGRLVPAGTATVDDDERPLLLSTRFLQEWLLRLTAAEIEEVRFLDDLEDVSTAGQVDGDVLTRDGDLWVPLPPSTNDHGQLTGRDDDDHPQYLLADGTRALTGELDAGAHRLTALANAQDAQDAVTLAQLDGVMHVGDAAGGDLDQQYPNPRVIALQGQPLSGVDPEKGFALVWDGEKWTPQRVSEGGGTVGRVLPFATIAPLGEQIYEIWFNFEAPENPIALRRLTKAHLTVFRETGKAPFLEKLDWSQILFDPPRRNVFKVSVPEAARGLGYLRFDFPLRKMRPTGDSPSLAQYAEDHGITYEGMFVASPDVTTVTRFVRDRQLDG